MTSFVHTSYPEQHPGVARIEAGVAAVRDRFDGKQGLASVMLSAIVAALLVLADQMVGALGDGHLLAGWVVLWAVAFAVLALLAPVISRLTVATVNALDAWARRVARARADERMWALAQQDPRVMADLRMAITRSEALEPPAAESNSKAAVRAELRPYPTWYV